MGFIGLEEIFLQVKDLEKAIDFYHNKLGIPLDKRDAERVYLQCDKGHVVLQIENHTGRHQGGGPLHFAFTVTEDTFDRVVERFVPSEFRTRGPMERQTPRKGRALFIFDPDGNEVEVNTRYLYDAPLR
jgi:catechol-2,3-dioxygenase